MANASIYAMLLVAIVLEVIGTTALQMSQQFTRLGPSIVLVRMLRRGLLLFVADATRYSGRHCLCHLERPWDCADLRSRSGVFPPETGSGGSYWPRADHRRGPRGQSLFEIRVTLDGCRAIYITLYVI